MPDNTTIKKKTYFFSERITISAKGIEADSFDEAQEQYLNLFAKNVKFGKLNADDSEMSCHSIDKDGNEVREY